MTQGYPVGEPWGLEHPGRFGDWTVWMIHSRGHEKVVAVLEAYLDESGIHGSAPWCLIAGFVASSRQWAWFENRWAKRTTEAEFHAKEFFARDQAGRRSRSESQPTETRVARVFGALIITANEF